MKKASTTAPSKLPVSQTDRLRLKSQAAAKPSPAHPEAQVKQILRGIVRKGLKPIPTKASISLRIDEDVLDWFKSQGTGYQTRMNAVLRGFRDASV